MPDKPPRPASPQARPTYEPQPSAAASRPEYHVRRPVQRPPVHPGVLMREILEDHIKLSISEAARRMKISRPVLVRRTERHLGSDGRNGAALWPAHRRRARALSQHADRTRPRDRRTAAQRRARADRAGGRLIQAEELWLAGVEPETPIATWSPGQR
jgi:hypothetical protein